MKSYAGGQVLGSPGWDPKFIQRLLDEDKRMRDKGTSPRDVIDMNKMWPKVQKAPTSDKDNWSQLLQKAPQIAHHGDIPELPKLGRASKINLSNFVASDGAMGKMPKQLKDIPRETWMPHLDDLLRK